VAEEDNHKPKGSEAEPDDEPTVSSGYTKETKPGDHYTKEPGQPWKKEDKKEAPERKITIVKHQWGKKNENWYNHEGYLGHFEEKGKKEGKFGSVKGETGFFRLKTEATSEISIDVDKRELNLTPIAAKVEFSAMHAEAEGEFKLGEWVASWFEVHEAKQSGGGTPGIPSLMAARVGDLTTHGSPLLPGIGSPDVRIGNKPAWRTIEDTHLCPIVKGLIPDVGGVVAVGSPTVFINFQHACRVGDMVVEIPGGPNPIAMGCPTVFIGSGKGEGITVKVKGEVDHYVAEGDLELGLVASKEEIRGKAKIGGMLALFKGAIEGGITIPLWGSHSLTLKAKAEGTLGSLGAEAEAEGSWTKEEGFHGSWRLGAHVGAGGSVGFSLGFK
jgi:uncharacterized Zn-binding protein involved in type VI secretion